MAKQDIGADEVLLEDSLEPRVYELGFHLDPELPSEEVKKAYHAVKDRVAENAAIVAEGEPQMVKLAYTISRQEPAGRRDFDSAYFSWIAYETTPEKHAEVVASTSANSHIIRFIDLVTTKDTVRHAVEMRELAAKVPERVGSDEPAATELDAALENVTV